jgi:hypothetical protein
MSISDGSSPDLTFYYTLSLKDNSELDETTFKNTILQNIKGIIYADSDLTQPIGEWLESNLIFNIYQNVNNWLYKRSGNQVFYLPEGTFNFPNKTPVTKDYEGKYCNQSGSFIYKIVGGSGNFLNSSGFIEITYNNTNLIRTVLVYFSKK